MAIDQRKYERKFKDILRDTRPLWMRMADWFMDVNNSVAMLAMLAGGLYFVDAFQVVADIVLLTGLGYVWWLATRDRSIAFKLPMGSPFTDKNDKGPGRDGTPGGILYLGNIKDTNEEMWFTNADARTHILYLGTTGAGKTEGLKSMVTNAMTWGSGFVYVDGKADTDLWSSLSSLVRRFGRDDDLLVLNYMTGNSDAKAPSNTMNPFSSGSASYLTQLLVGLMAEAEGDNAMWKERAVALISSIMPCLTWKRDHQDMPLSVSTIKKYLELKPIIRLSREEAIPEKIRSGIQGYLGTLPGYMEEAFDDNGELKPPNPNLPPVDFNTISNQHGYLSMQFTRSLQSLGDEYGYIFDTQAADIDMVDVVLNRRVLVVLIPALEKSGDEIANLGKIIAATMKGMMGSTLGATVEGESSAVIENKPTRAATPFMTVFDEVGYYTAQGMAVMAAQARSLGFCLIFSGQDLPAMKKRVKEEANSITANCNIKIFGKLEDPTETKEFFDKTVGTAIVMEVQSYQVQGGVTDSYFDTQSAQVQLRPRASYDGLKSFKEGEATVCFGDRIMDATMFYSNPGDAKAMRVTRFMELAPPDDNVVKHAPSITKLRDLMVHKTWTAEKADVAIETDPFIRAMADGFSFGEGRDNVSPLEQGILAVTTIYANANPEEMQKPPRQTALSASAPAAAPAAASAAEAELSPSSEQPVSSSSAPAEPQTKPAEPPPPPAQEVPLITELAGKLLGDAGRKAHDFIFGKTSGAGDKKHED